MPVGAMTVDLRVAVAVLLAELQGAVPGRLGMVDEIAASGQEAWSSGTGLTREALVAVRLRHARRGDGCG